MVSLGDLFWKGEFPYVDVYNEGSVTGLSVAIKDILKRTDASTAIISGHGDVASKDDLMNFGKMLSTSIDHIAKAVAKGQTLAKIQEEGLPEHLKAWSSKLVPEKKWIEFVYLSVIK